MELPLFGAEPVERADAARNRRRILAAAERLFAERGVHCTSMDAIAVEAGVGKGTLFRRFGDRASLARALFSEREAAFQDACMHGPPPLGPGAPACERLIAFGHALLELLEVYGDLLAAAEGPADRASAPYGFRHVHVVSLLRDAAPGLDPDVTADALLGLLRARVFRHQRVQREMPLERLEAGWTALVRRLMSEG